MDHNGEIIINKKLFYCLVMPLNKKKNSPPFSFSSFFFLISIISLLYYVLHIYIVHNHDSIKKNHNIDV
jgi:hypothetical protein